jgi:ADP-ribosyl-[dinitrogen reductase] hydrolase
VYKGAVEPRREEPGVAAAGGAPAGAAESGAPDRALDLRTRARGCLLGGALGDALGAPIEFLPWPMIRALRGGAGLETLEPAFGRPGAITDDTQMMLFTAEGLIRGRVRTESHGEDRPLAAVHRAYLRWLHTQGVPWPEALAAHGLTAEHDRPDGWLIGHRFLHSRRAPGSTCLGALARPLADGRVAANESKGCGGVMRVAPVGLLERAGGGEPDGAEGIFRLAVACAALTHGHPTGQLPAGVLAATVHALAHERLPLERALDLATEILLGQPHHEETSAALAAARDLAGRGDPTTEKLQTLGGGWVAEEALAIAVYAALSQPRDLRRALILAVNHSGDSDSTGALAGNLLGAALGEGALPEDWLRELEGQEVIRELADDLVAEVLALRPRRDRAGDDGPDSWAAWYHRYPG